MSEKRRRDLVVFGRNDSSERLRNLCLCLNRETAHLIGQFLIQCAEEMASNDEWEHVHLSDHLGDRISTDCDVVVMHIDMVIDAGGD